MVRIRPASERIAIWQGGLHSRSHPWWPCGNLIFARLKQISFWQLVDLVSPSYSGTGDRSGISSTLKFRASHRLFWKLFIPPRSPSSEYANFTYSIPLYESLGFNGVWLLLTLFFRSLKAKPRLKAGTLFLILVATAWDACGSKAYEPIA